MIWPKGKNSTLTAGWPIRGGDRQIPLVWEMDVSSAKRNIWTKHVNLFSEQATLQWWLFKQVLQLNTHDYVMLRSETFSAVRGTYFANCFACYCITGEKNCIKNDFDMVAQPGTKENEPILLTNWHIFRSYGLTRVFQESDWPPKQDEAACRRDFFFIFLASRTVASFPHWANPSALNSKTTT